MVARPLLLAAAVVALAGCGGGGGTNTASSAPVGPCKLDAAQRRAVARAQADIRQLRRIEAPLTRFSERGTPAQETVTGKFLTDMGSAKLPADVRGHLIHVAKSAVGLCGLCFQGLEAQEPVLAGKLGEKRCPATRSPTGRRP